MIEKIKAYLEKMELEKEDIEELKFEKKCPESIFRYTYSLN